VEPRRRKYVVAPLAAALLASALAGCRSRDSEELAEAGAVSHAITRLREASNPEKRVALRALAGVPCSRPAVGELKELCADAYTKHADALAGMSAARHAMQGDAGADDIESVAKLVRGSEALLEIAGKAVKQCADREGELRRSLGF
jgi:hypothetical protein